MIMMLKPIRSPFRWAKSFGALPGRIAKEMSLLPSDGCSRFLRPKGAEGEHVVEVVQGINSSAYPLRIRQGRSKIVMSARGAAAVEARE